MTPETTMLLEKLAIKLGTTTEFIWTVLLTQAKITAFTDIIAIFIFVPACYIFYKIVKDKTTKKLKEGYTDHYESDWQEESKFFATLGLIILIATTVIIFFLSISNIITVMINPDYWVLNKILWYLK